MVAPQSVYVVDDEPQVLDSVRCLLQTEKHDVQCFSTAKEFLAKLKPDTIGCLITDLQMPEVNGLELQERLVAMDSLLSVIVVTGRADVGSAVRMMRNGAITLLEKPYPAEVLLKEVRNSLYLSQRRAERRGIRDRARRLLALLDEDEFAVMQLAAEGLPNKAIAHRLALSPRTVDRRRQSAMQKLGISSPAGFMLLLAQAEDEDDYEPEKDAGKGRDLQNRTKIEEYRREIDDEKKKDDDEDSPPLGKAAV